DGVPRAAHLRQLRLQRAALGAEHELASVEHALGGGHQLGLERGVLPSEVEEGDHRWPPDSMAPRPTLVLMGPLTPSRLRVKRISSSRLARLMSSIASAQHCQCSSIARRFSANVFVCTSQLMLPRVVSHAHGLTLNPPDRKVLCDGSL